MKKSKLNLWKKSLYTGKTNDLKEEENVKPSLSSFYNESQVVNKQS